MTAAALHKQSNEQSSVGVFPENWRSVTVAEVAARKPNAIVGGPFGSDLVSNDYVPLGVPVIRGQNMTAHFVSGEFAFVSLEKAKRLAANTAVPGDIVFTQRGTLGQVALVPKGVFKFYVISQSQMKLSPDPQNFDPTYILQYFVSYVGQRMILESAIQTGVPHTNLGILRAYRLPAPPIEEQRAIAEALSDADAFVESLEQLLSKKCHLKQGAIQELLTGKKRLPGFSGAWEVRLLGQIAPLQRGFDLPNGMLQRGPFPVVYSNGVLTYHSVFQVKGPGVVTGRSGTIGKVTFVEQDFWPHNTTLWVTSFKGNDPKFVFFLYTRVSLERFATGSGVPTLNRNDVHQFKISVPATRVEQTAIAAILSDMDAEIAALEAKLAKARNLKQGMMQELLTGRIRLV